MAKEEICQFLDIPVIYWSICGRPGKGKGEDLSNSGHPSKVNKEICLSIYTAVKANDEARFFHLWTPQ